MISYKCQAQCLLPNKCFIILAVVAEIQPKDIYHTILLLFSHSVESNFCNPMDCSMPASLSILYLHWKIDYAIEIYISFNPLLFSVTLFWQCCSLDKMNHCLLFTEAAECCCRKVHIQTCWYHDKLWPTFIICSDLERAEELEIKLPTSIGS